MLPSIPIAGLPMEHKTLSSGLYWLLCGNRQDADLLTADFLSAGLGSQSAGLLCGAQTLQRLLDMLEPPLSSSIGVHTYTERKDRHADGFLQEFLAHPDRLQDFLTGSRSRLSLLRSSHADNLGIHLGNSKLHAFNQRLKKSGKTLLVVLDSPVRPEISFNNIADKMQGCARLYRADAALVFDVFYWSNQLGLFSDLRYRLRWEGKHLKLDEPIQVEAKQSVIGADDAHKIVFQQESLRGLPLLSPAWSALDSYAEMVSQAGSAHSLTMVFALQSNMQVKQLASDFQNLRTSGNSGLKLVVREVVSCLRYGDQKTLLLSGASFIIPESVSNQHMLLYLSALQGLEWNRPLIQNPEMLFEKQQPLDLRGILDAELFFEKAGKVFRESMGEMTHQLLEFGMQPEVSEAMLSSQLELRRYGDIATFFQGKFYLLLFACPDSALRLALHNVFKLPIAELFMNVRKVTDINRLESLLAGSEDLLQQLAMTEKSVPVMRTERLTPKLVPLTEGWT